MRFFLISTLLISACSIGSTSQTDVSEYNNSSGYIKVHVATRGSYQYVLYADDGKRYMPASPLAEVLKEDGTRVRFTGTVLPEKAVVYKPAPNDAPVKDFEVQKILLTEIEKQ
jgi:hypothetical protein